MKKIIITALIFCVLAGVDSQASTLTRRENIQSKGIINYEQGKVVLDSRDLLYLADEVDALEDTYKTGIVNSLNSIGTYFRKDGTAVYEVQENQILTETEKKSLPYSKLLQGIKESQSVSMLASVQATNERGESLFYLSQESKGAENHLETGTTETEFPLYYKGASANNISAGCAAWVNGVLIKGNGADLERMRENGYREGYAKGIAEALDQANIVYTYHQHVGKEDAVGGCYGRVTKTRPVACGCNDYVYAESTPGTAACGNCWHNHQGVCSYVVSHEPYTAIGLICNKTTDTIESATIQY